MAKYSEQFKVHAVGLLRELNKEKALDSKGSIVVDNVKIENVRDLVTLLDVSSYTIYKWNRELFGEVVEVDDDNSDDESDVDFFDEKEVEISISTGEKKDIFGIRYYAWFARNLGVKNYSKMVLAQLKLSIGVRLIGQSGLVDMNKANKKLSQNAINYIEKHGRL